LLSRTIIIIVIIIVIIISTFRDIKGGRDCEDLYRLRGNGDMERDFSVRRHCVGSTSDGTPDGIGFLRLTDGSVFLYGMAS
jgi:hypothetical protein